MKPKRPALEQLPIQALTKGSQWRAMHLTMIAPPMSAWLCVKSVPFRPPTVASCSQACVHTALKRLSSTDHLEMGGGGGQGTSRGYSMVKVKVKVIRFDSWSQKVIPGTNRTTCGECMQNTGRGCTDRAW